jgi:hypothetical protein
LLVDGTGATEEERQNAMKNATDKISLVVENLFKNQASEASAISSRCFFTYRWGI